ncbi:MAG: hypothetical protein IPK03_05950 [Bacteroidetes bacterium]|nr:hypothetical protein [Bacteroidota bacterium]
MITIAFGIAGAILLESSLSFLGIGVAPEEVTWGSLLSASRSYVPSLVVGDIPRICHIHHGDAFQSSWRRIDGCDGSEVETVSY